MIEKGFTHKTETWYTTTNTTLQQQKGTTKKAKTKGQTMHPKGGKKKKMREDERKRDLGFQLRTAPSSSCFTVTACKQRREWSDPDRQKDNSRSTNWKFFMVTSGRQTRTDRKINYW